MVPASPPFSSARVMGVGVGVGLCRSSRTQAAPVNRASAKQALRVTPPARPAPCPAVCRALCGRFHKLFHDGFRERFRERFRDEFREKFCGLSFGPC